MFIRREMPSFYTIIYCLANGNYLLDLLALLPLWLGDEQRHYQALRRLYHCLSGLDFTTMDAHFKRRSPELGAIKWVLEDEFTIVSTLVFDELGSMFSYRRDLREYYRPFGKLFARVGQHLVQDEGSHFRHFLNILKDNYPHRLKELPDFFQQSNQIRKIPGALLPHIFIRSRPGNAPFSTLL